MKRLRKLQVLPFIMLAVLLSSCGSDNSSKGQSQGNTYKETKTMVLDILKSDDGKKAISTANRSIMNGDAGASGLAGQSQIKLLSANESLQLQMAVKDVLTAQENNKFLQDMMKDPKFAGDFAKAIQKDTKQMFKELLKDPEYQKALVDVMKNPDYEKMVLDVMKTAAYRQQMMTVMQEAVKSPLFRAEMVDLLKSAIEQQSQPEQLPSGGQQKKGGGDSGSEKEGDKKKEQKSGSGDSQKQDSGQKKDSSSSDS
ncbi:spore gernimation protein [Paenibacillus sp. SYP-B3998]|uniref:Spore gernimation protein n=2 Tax=Paenibacillus sp. SYP-B3998 TaxID=2678564 RepID=A0A6G4A538_9BACL|nr:spore gernimation protein [Paenibacillus sp. SYP-B3998]